MLSWKCTPGPNSQSVNQRHANVVGHSRGEEGVGPRSRPSIGTYIHRTPPRRYRERAREARSAAEASLSEGGPVEVDVAVEVEVEEVEVAEVVVVEEGEAVMSPR